MKVKVLIVDDSALVRKILSDGLSEDPDIEVVGIARDPYEARDMLVLKRPDVITLDVEMPKMDGLTFLKKYMAVYPTPTVMVSSLTERGKKIALEALEAGAVDIVTKPKIGVADELPRMLAEIRAKVKMAARVDVSKFARQASTKPAKIAVSSYALDESTDKVIAIGASTGGTEALARILPAFPATSPGIVLVQHMPEGFTKTFAQRLDSLSQVKVKEAEDNDRVLPGLCLLAPGGARHMEVIRSGGQYRVKLREGQKVSGHRPSAPKNR
jgi:two-component system chemotaxis response regulator CheB